MKYRLIESKEIKRFKCIGGACEDTCCKGWAITIDQKTCNKYRFVKNNDLRVKLKKNVILPTVENQQAKMRLKKDCSCFFLTNEGLCEIHAKVGSEYLSDVCATYPQVIHNVNGDIERTLTLACPEAARIILLNEEGIVFEEQETHVSLERSSTIRNMSTTTGNKASYKEYFYEIRYVTTCILKDRSYSIEERLMILGMLYNRLSENKENDVQDIPSILGEYMDALENGTFRGAFEEIEPRIKEQLRLSQELLVARLLSDINSERYLVHSRAVMEGLNIGKGTNEEIIEKYTGAYKQYVDPFIKEHEYILENYLVNYAFANKMPLGDECIFDVYYMMVLHYAIIYFDLIGIAAKNKGLTVKSVIDTIQIISRVFDHNYRYFKNINTKFKGLNMDNLETMMIFIKH